MRGIARGLIHALIKKIMTEKANPKVLVVVVYTAKKGYCEWLFPIVFDKLTYENKTPLFVTEKNYPELDDCSTGEAICSLGRNIGITYAKEHGFDYILQLDSDLDTPEDTIERLLATGKPLVGGAVAARGNENALIGHNYKQPSDFERLQINKEYGVGLVEVDGTSGSCLLIARSIFSKISLDSYTGPAVIRHRYTGEDEYYQMLVFKKFGIKPFIDFNLKPWHHDANGWKYRLWGDKKYWRE